MPGSPFLMGKAPEESGTQMMDYSQTHVMPFASAN